MFPPGKPRRSSGAVLREALFRLNHSRLWHRSVRLGDVRYRAATADRLLALWLHRLGLLGRQEVRVFSSVVRPGMRVADVGANQGIFTVLLSRLVGKTGTVFAFEPEPHLFHALGRNCDANHAQNVRALPVALGEEDSTAILRRSPLHSGDNRLCRTPESGGVEVPVRRLDGLIDGRLDFIKLDVQGHELPALRGMDKTLAVSPSLVIYLELWPYGLRSAGTHPCDLLDFLGERGFRILDPATRREYHPSAWDVLLARVPRRKYMNLLASRP